ncbi:response regulator [Thalassospira marina]|uniref:Response regulator n=2 Tax=Thalassospira marina TaxID=2048283 RepID=A0ABM6QBC0_9PROT|nr:response regulator [Thalassospira marina]
MACLCTRGGRRQMKNVLLVEDDNMVRQTIASGLNTAGFNVRLAIDGNQAIKSFQRNRPDIVVMDIIMPDLGGIEAIPELRKLDATIPIIAMSGGGRTQNFEFLEIAKRSGANEILPKPFRVRMLVEIITRLL